MRKLNLLPHRIRQSQRARKQKIFLAVLQVAILLCIGIAFLAINVQERVLTNRSQNLAAQLAGLDDRPFQLVAELNAATILTQNFDDFYRANFPVNFETEWFETILHALPDDANLFRLSYRHTEILVEGDVSDILYVEAFRQAVWDTGVFENVRQGRVSLQSGGRFIFELYVRVRSNE